MRLCECGCGLVTRMVTAPWGDYKAGDYLRFIHGHHLTFITGDHGRIGRLRANAARRAKTRTTPAPSKRASHERARTIVAGNRCAWEHIGHCKGRLDVAHMDQNPFNNSPDNLLLLCRSHHFLYDRGRIDRANPTMPTFYVSSGKRRYVSRAPLSALADPAAPST